MPHRNKNQNTPVVGAQSLVVIGIVDHGPEVSHLSLCRTVCCSLHAFGIMFGLLSFSSRRFTPTPEALLLLPEFFFLFVLFFCLPSVLRSVLCLRNVTATAQNQNMAMCLCVSEGSNFVFRAILLSGPLSASRSTR